MPNCSESLGSGRAARCAVCEGKFGLIRYYSWRTSLCSKKCVDRFRARRASDRNWLPWLQIALESVRKDHAGLHSFLSMSRIDARRRNARPRRLRFSQSLARRLHRPSHANVRSTTHRLGKTMKPFA